MQVASTGMMGGCSHSQIKCQNLLVIWETETEVCHRAILGKRKRLLRGRRRRCSPNRKFLSEIALDLQYAGNASAFDR